MKDEFAHIIPKLARQNVTLNLNLGLLLYYPNYPRVMKNYCLYAHFFSILLKKLLTLSHTYETPMKKLLQSTMSAILTIMCVVLLQGVNFTKNTRKPLVFKNSTDMLYTLTVFDTTTDKLTTQSLSSGASVTLAPDNYNLSSLTIISKQDNKPALFHVFEYPNYTCYTVVEKAQLFDSFQLDFDAYLKSNSSYYTDCITDKKIIYPGNITSHWYRVSLPKYISPAAFISRMRELYYTHFTQAGTQKSSCTTQASVTSRIPKILHQIWIGSQPMPENYAANQKKWQALHPGWIYKFWTNADLEQFSWSSPKIKKVFDQAHNYAAQADILKIELLHKYGGVYVDLDTEPYEPLDGLVHRFDFFGLLYGPYKGTLVIDAFFLGACPGHRVMAQALKNIIYLAHHIPDISHVTKNKKFVYNLISAVMPLTHAVWSCAGRHNTRDIILPIRYFNNHALSSVSYGVHYPERSWAKNKPKK